MDKKKELELYIHIPFCVRKCKYCDFLSAPADEKTKNAYMEAICKEIAEKSELYNSYEVTTIFIGGGTPTAVEPRWIKRMMQIVKENYTISGDAEITMEANPGTVNADAFEMYRDAGINRLSIGLQSTEDTELEMLGRIHSYEQFLETYECARKAGFTNINVDIMSALPGQTLESYEKTLQRVVNLKPAPEHISAYSLIVEEGTSFYEIYEQGDLELPDEDTERNMYSLTEEYLKEYGYERYEISNYAKKGKECRHNLGYWKRIDYVGFGIGAASLVKNTRFSNGKDLSEYIDKPCEVEEKHQYLSMEEQMEETMFLGLRMTDGVSLNRFEGIFGVPVTRVYQEVISKHVAEGLLEVVTEKDEERILRLTTKGMDVCNYVMSDFLEPNL